MKRGLLFGGKSAWLLYTLDRTLRIEIIRRIDCESEIYAFLPYLHSILTYFSVGLLNGHIFSHSQLSNYSFFCSSLTLHLQAKR